MTQNKSDEFDNAIGSLNALICELDIELKRLGSLVAPTDGDIARRARIRWVYQKYMWAEAAVVEAHAILRNTPAWEAAPELLTAAQLMAIADAQRTVKRATPLASTSTVRGTAQKKARSATERDRSLPFTAPRKRAEQ